MKTAYRSTKFRPDSLVRIVRMNEVLAEYNQKLTARQLYYQFVARGWLANTERNYKGITNLLTDARYAGLVDWSAIEDRGREPESPSQWDNIQGLVNSALRSYRLPRWEGQEHYVELWVEKQALAGVLSPLAWEFHVTLMVNKGYSSASAMKESADRILSRPEGTLPIVFYLGDHDPSGEDMVRDIRDRLREFDCTSIDVRKLALTMEQIKKFNPPPNPAKITDSRAMAYIARHGDSSWELDALPPDELTRIVSRAFESVIDIELMDKVKAREEKDKKRLRAAAATL